MSGKATPKANLTLLPEFDVCVGELGNKASWLVKVYQKPYLEPHNQQFLLFTTTVLYADSVSPQRERVCLDLDI